MQNDDKQNQNHSCQYLWDFKKQQKATGWITMLTEHKIEGDPEAALVMLLWEGRWPSWPDLSSLAPISHVWAPTIWHRTKLFFLQHFLQKERGWLLSAICLISGHKQWTKTTDWLLDFNSNYTPRTRLRYLESSGFEDDYVQGLKLRKDKLKTLAL